MDGKTRAIALYNTVTLAWTTINDPLGVNDTNLQGINGNNIVGYYSDASSASHGFLYNISTQVWTTVDDPLASNATNKGTFPTGISGSTIVGEYFGIGSPQGGDGFIAVPTPEPSSARAD